MSLQLVYGPARSGKSTIMQQRIIEMAIKNPGQQFLLIVPDQFTMQTQMDIVKKHPNGGIMNIDVLSFSRLTYRVFSETGRPDYAVLDDTGKSLVLRHVASSVADKMPYIGANLSKIGYLHEVKSMISEFMQYGLSTGDVAKLADSLEPGLLQTKLRDLNVIYEAFNAYNKDKFVTSEETLDILCRKLPEADFVRDSYIVFDGFTGFTPIQERVIMKLLELASKVVITLTLSNPEKPDETGAEEKLFYLTRTTGNRLASQAKERNIAVEPYETANDNGCSFLNNEISHLEKNIFRPSFNKYEGSPGNISVFQCDSIETEIAEITLRIHELVRNDGYAYRDIAVVTGDLGAYGDNFENRMKELNIPCFIDRTTGIVLNPFIEYLKSALQIVIKDFSFDSVFHFLKSGFTDYEADAVDRFEQYVASLNIRGKSAYSKPFTRRQKGMKKEFAISEIAMQDELRQQLFSDISVLLKPSETAGQYVQNLYEFLRKNNSYEKLKQYETMFEEANNLPKAREYGQIYKLVMELLDTIYKLIGDEKMDITEFYRIFEAGISEIQVGTIPRNVDRIVVGDIERTRLNDVKILFFAGVNDGNIPRAAESGGILSNTERMQIADRDYDLSPTDQTKMYTQRLYLYSNLCTPSDRLFISYAGTDREGKGLKPSYLISQIKKLFPALEVQRIEDSLTLERMVNMRDSYRFYSGLVNRYSLRALGNAEKQLAECLLKLYKEQESDISDRINDAAFYEYASSALSGEIVKLIYGETLIGSISRMEKYARCAYAHFLMYGMELQEKAEADFASRDLGSIYHGVIDIFASELEARGYSFADFPEEEGMEIFHSAIEKYCEDYEQGILRDDEQTRYIVTKITRIMETAIKNIKYQVSQGNFIPKYHERSFCREIALEDGMMQLKGRIDRIDIYTEDDKIYVRIVDYKSSDRKIDITNVYHGIEQQLPLYLAEAIYHEKQVNSGCEVIPAALFYYTVSNPIVNLPINSTDEEITKSIRRELRYDGMLSNREGIVEAMDRDASEGTVLPVSITSKGAVRSSEKIVTEQELTNLSGYTEKLITSIGNRIVRGDISISPIADASGENSSCDYCSYKSVCRFDRKIPGYTVRNKGALDKAEIKERVLGGKEDGLYLFN